MGIWRQPGDTLAVSDNWLDHRARGSLGGTDFKDGRGTIMRAMHDGIVTIVDNSYGGSGGAYVRVTGYDGESTEQLHALRITAVRGQRVSKGDPIGISAGSGFGAPYYYGDHIHAHAISRSGIRYSVEPNVFGGANSTTSGGNATPIEERLIVNDDDARKVETIVRDQVGAIVRDTILPKLKEYIDASRNTEHQEIAGRLDKVIAPTIREGFDNAHQEIAGRIDKVLAPSLRRIEAAVDTTSEEKPPPAK